MNLRNSKQFAKVLPIQMYTLIIQSVWFTKSCAKDWLVKVITVLVCIFINKEKESSLRFGKVYLLPGFIYASIDQSFPHQIATFTNLPKVSLPPLSSYTVRKSAVWLVILIYVTLNFH